MSYSSRSRKGGGLKVFLSLSLLFSPLGCVIQAFMSRYQAALLGLGLLLMLLLYVGLPGPSEKTSQLSRGPNVTVQAGLTRGNPQIFYREALPIQRAHR